MNKDIEDLLNESAKRSLSYLNTLGTRRVFPTAEAIQNLNQLTTPLPDNPTDPKKIISLLDEVGSPATVASAGGRYFGFVTGGALPSTVATSWLAGAWDQPADMVIASPIGSKIEEVIIDWITDILTLPKNTAMGFVTGATMANFVGLAAARHAILKKVGWDVESNGLFGAPEINVVVSDQVHVSMLKALSMVGLGRDRITRVPVDSQGRMIVSKMPQLNEKTIVCVLAGNVNTGDFDPADEICEIAKQNGAWVHVDGAFGMWAGASPSKKYLTKGINEADSWSFDAHKWLNVPYDSGIVACRDDEAIKAAMSFDADYLIQGNDREPGQYTPEMSRRARGIEIWAALLSLGKSGLADLIDKHCEYARSFAKELQQSGYEILNDVVLNQVMVSFGDDETTNKIIKEIQDEGTCWCGGTTWQGRSAMRISVSSWATTEEDVNKSIEAIKKIAKGQLKRS